MATPRNCSKHMLPGFILHVKGGNTQYSAAESIAWFGLNLQKQYSDCSWCLNTCYEEMRWQTLQILSSALGEPPLLLAQAKQEAAQWSVLCADTLNELLAPDKIQKAIIYSQSCFVLMETTLIKNSQRRKQTCVRTSPSVTHLECRCWTARVTFHLAIQN